MKFKGTAALAILLIGIVLYYFLIDLPSEKREKEEKDLSEKVIPFNPEDVETISILKVKNTIALKRTSANLWKITKPVRAKGDSEAISDFISFLNNLNFTRVIEESPKNLSTFGLDTPSLQVILSMKNGETKGVVVGDDHPMGNKTYLARLNEKHVLTADITKSSINRKVYELRDKTILEFKTPQINMIELIHDKESLTFKKNKTSWQLVKKEITAKGSEGEITNLLNTIRTARIEKFIEEEPDQLTPYGLKNSKHIVKLTTSKEKEPLTLFIGKKSQHGFYAKTLSKENIFVINNSLFDTLSNRKLVDFLNKSLVEFNDNDLNQVTLKTDDDMIDLIRDKKDLQNWTMVKPIKIKANTATINSLLFDLKNTRIVDFSGDSKKFSPAQPEKEISLTYKNGKTWTLKLGNQTSNPDHYFAQRTDEKTAFTLKKSSIETIFRSLHDLKDRTVLEFDDNAVREIQINDSKQNFILKKAEDKWKLTQPKPSESIQSFIGKDILWTLNSIEFESALSTDPGNTATGVTKPQVSIKLLDDKGTVLTHMMIGNAVAQSPELRYLKAAKNPTVYTVKKRFLDELLSNLNRLKDKL
ncbi:uncharacterized protein METZ01_LOCUS174668 [marine metagenome]|uniref:DUF4340 domain-containing protein n=1 Tax=marine metagenome TaxID=408172 RepID=A0A382C7F1_9ZZZZ